MTSAVGKSATQAIYYHLGKEFALKREDFLQNPQVFAEGLEKLFGYGAQFIERMILKKLYSMVGANFEEKDECTFADYVKEAARQRRRRTASKTFPKPLGQVNASLTA